MSSKAGQRLVKYAFSNMKAQGATHKAPIRFALRRARQVALLLRLRLDVLLAVEVGSPTEARALGTMLKRVGSGLRLVPFDHHKSGQWRYIYVNPKYVTVHHAGLFTLPTKYQGDAKEAAWIVATVRGRLSLFVGAHLENSAPIQFKVDQAHDVHDLIVTLKGRYGVAWKDIYLGVDTNDGTGRVQAYLESTALTSATKTAKKVVGTSWLSQNNWLARRGAARKVTRTHRSMDWIGAGVGRPHSTVIQYDTHTMQDHDMMVATAVFR